MTDDVPVRSEDGLRGLIPASLKAFQEWEELCYDAECIPGRWHDWQLVNEHYGADYDGNRGIWLRYLECRNCGATCNEH